MHGMKYTNNKNNISEILKVYIINSITKSYILNIKIRPFVTEYALTIKLVGGTSSAHSFNPYAYFGHSWSYFDIQNLWLVILYISSKCHRLKMNYSWVYRISLRWWVESLGVWSSVSYWQCLILCYQFSYMQILWN
jgi:hypothetical protein